MTTPPSSAPRERGISLGDLAVALGVVALGLFFLIETFSIEVNPGYARVGPRFFPLLVSFGLLGVGALLTIGALRGERATPAAEEDADPDAPTNWVSVGWISLGVLLTIALLSALGFILTSALLFWCVARGFHSDKPLRDLVIAALLSVIVYFVFTSGLGLTLPAGVLKGL
ncbi:tripartite tricarboxylate transporter TctB family protein [Deinococcus peraridilitoris]|uniref:Tripartite tricarboxylate transporter TctB family n=1 Tax=Deinococcus peraridilitoris (strain DSM 19664 / LMG 22246 / CIP 109416 / KR-200) TaxID=937777 RepID=L0A0W7_DEIPD|nr:tripartite tricarboxylate transporter TctB family protein [Deinococcus peraridilitoris]AFZ66827.1 Tripartite tricarboxylate transporter TctB family [Deinococcus peraridilitoris DSM 19664]